MVLKKQPTLVRGIQMNVVLGKAGLTNLFIEHVRSHLDWQEIGEYGVAVQRRLIHMISRARARTRRGGRQCTYGTNLRGDKKASGRHDPGLQTLLWQESTVMHGSKRHSSNVESKLNCHRWPLLDSIGKDDTRGFH